MLFGRICIYLRQISSSVTIILIIAAFKSISLKKVPDTFHARFPRFDPVFIVMHHSIPAAPSPPPPPGWPPGISIFLPWLANSRGWGLLSCQNPRGGDKKGGLMPRPPSTLQHFSLIAQSNNAVLIILMCDFSSSFVIALGFWWRLHAATAYTSLGF